MNQLVFQYFQCPCHPLFFPIMQWLPHVLEQFVSLNVFNESVNVFLECSILNPPDVVESHGYHNVKSFGLHEVESARVPPQIEMRTWNRFLTVGSNQASCRVDDVTRTLYTLFSSIGALYMHAWTFLLFCLQSIC